MFLTLLMLAVTSLFLDVKAKADKVPVLEEQVRTNAKLVEKLSSVPEDLAMIKAQLAHILGEAEMKELRAQRRIQKDAARRAAQEDGQ